MIIIALMVVEMVVDLGLAVSLKEVHVGAMVPNVSKRSLFVAVQVEVDFKVPYVVLILHQDQL